MTTPKFRHDILLNGFPGRCSRGFLGWSTITLLTGGGRHVLFDTGAAGDRPGLIAALDKRGLKPADIDTVILSHLHFDHVANVECFPQAEVIVHEDEMAYFHAERGRDPALSVYLTEGMLRHARMTFVGGEPELLDTVQLFRTPGHTGGHCSLLLTADGRRIVLAQDALKHRGEAAAGGAPGSFDEAASAHSIGRILKLADIVVPGHDAPLAIRDGEVVAAGSLAELITVTIDNRRIDLEVAP